MKWFFTLCMSVILFSCSSNADQEKDSVTKKNNQQSPYAIKRDNTYVDLQTQKEIQLEYDSLGKVVEQGTGRRVMLFVDKNTLDTIDQNGNIVNHKVHKKQDGTYEVNE